MGRLSGLYLGLITRRTYRLRVMILSLPAKIMFATLMAPWKYVRKVPAHSLFVSMIRLQPISGGLMKSRLFSVRNTVLLLGLISAQAFVSAFTRSPRLLAFESASPDTKAVQPALTSFPAAFF